MSRSRDLATYLVPDARVPASSVSQHVTPYSDTKIRSDISINALRYAVTENKNAYNLPNSFIDNFNDSSGIGSTSSAGLGDEFVVSQSTASTAHQSYSSIADSAFAETGHGFNWPSGKSTGLGYLNAQGSSKAFYIGGDVNSWNSSTAFTIDVGNTNTKLDYVEYYATDIGGTNANFHNVSLHTSLDNSSFTQHNITMSEGATGSSAQTQNQANSTDMHKLTLDTPTTFRYVKFQIHSAQTAGEANPAMSSFRLYTKTVSTSATGHIISTANVPSSARSKVSGVILYKDNEGTATLGGGSYDLKVSFTCNGSTYTEASAYTAITPVFSTGIKMVRLGETTCTSGSDIRYKVEWANQSAGSKETQLHGIALNY